MMSISSSSPLSTPHIMRVGGMSHRHRIQAPPRLSAHHHLRACYLASQWPSFVMSSSTVVGGGGRGGEDSRINIEHHRERCRNIERDFESLVLA
jgi:hypothetical protein